MTKSILATEPRTDGIQLSVNVQHGLRKGGVDEKIIFALEVAMAYSGVDTYAKSYAHGMDRAFDEFGVEGVYFNVLYLLMNLGKWKGEQARETKAILKKWKFKS
jgi:hypothetical protein